MEIMKQVISWTLPSKQHYLATNKAPNGTACDVNQRTLYISLQNLFLRVYISIQSLYLCLLSGLSIAVYAC